MRFLSPPSALLPAPFLTASALSQAQKTDCMDRTFVANVADHRIVPNDLTQDNFQVRYHGHVLSPRHVAYSEGPRRVIVLLDVSGSMRSPQGDVGKWKVARQAAWALVGALLPGSKAGLITFSTTVKTRAPLSSSREPIAHWLNDEKALNAEVLNGRTALYDAIQSAVDQLRPSEPGDSIYLITDGGDNSSNIKQSKVRMALRDSGVRLFALLLPEYRYTSRLQFADPQNLSRLSEDSGGFMEPLDLEHGFQVFGERKQNLRTHTDWLSLRISAFYSLSVDLPENPQKATRWELTYVESGKRKKDVWLGYPHEVPPCHLRQLSQTPIQP